MNSPTAWTADVPDAFLSVWQDGRRWRYRVRSTTGHVWRSTTRESASAARATAAREYKARVGRDAAQRVSWTPCAPKDAQAHGEDAQARAQARRVSSHVAECVRRQESAGPRPLSLAPGRRTPPTEIPDPCVVERVDSGAPPVGIARWLRLTCGEVPTDDERYLRWIRTLPCCVCGAQAPTEAHHEPPKGMGGRNDCDYNAVPTCGHHHRLRHGQDGHRDDDPPASVLKQWLADARLPLVLAYFAGSAGQGRRR